MIKLAVLLTFTFLFFGCANKHGISAKYYSDCKEYYDFQGYYHKECGEDDIITYKELKAKTKRSIHKGVNATKRYITGEEAQKPEPEPNVW
jgi:hypothetical protein